MQGRQRLSFEAALAAVLLVIVLAGMALTHQNRLLTLPVAVVAVGMLVGLARRAGLSWDEVGLGRAQMASGIRWGATGVGVLALGYLVVAVLPVGDAVFADDAMPTSGVEALVRVAVVIPLRTVLIEELAFRGVLWGLLAQRWGGRAATVGAAIAFGLWHVPAGLRLVESNQAVADLVATSSGAGAAVVFLVVLLVVAGTALAGVGFSELRRRSGSIAAPMLVHWALNSMGTLLSFVR